MAVPSTDGSASRPGALRIALNSAVRFDHSAVSRGAALRATAGCVGVLVVALPLLGDAGAAAATVGALLAAIPSISSVARRPLATMGAATFGVALSTFVGSASAPIAWVHLAILVAWCFGGGLLVALGDTGSIVGTQAAMAFIVFGRFAQPVGGAAKLAGYVAAGGAVQIALVAATRWPIALLAQRQTLAAAYRLLGELALGEPERSSIPAGLALDAAEAAVASPTIVRRADVSILWSLADEGRRMRVELGAIAALRAQSKRSPGGNGGIASTVHAVLEEVSSVLERIAGAIDHGGEVATDALDRAVDEAERIVGTPVDGNHAIAPARLDPLPSALAEHLASLAGQVRAAAVLASEAGPGKVGVVRPSRRGIAEGALGSVAAQLALLRANLTLHSTAWRHAVRLAIVVPVAELLADHSPLQRGYWVALTAAIVLRPDFASTFSRGFARLGGTIAGVAITGLIVAGGHLGGAPAVVIIGVLCFGAFASFRASFAVYSALLTGLVVVLVNLATPGAHATLSTVADRLVDTVIGGALALSTYALWPTWTADEVRASLRRLLTDERAYLDAVLGDISGASTHDEGELRSLARRLRLDRTNSEAVVARSLAEPQAHRFDGPLAAGVLAGARRLSLTTHVLRRSLPGGRSTPVLELEPLRLALVDALTIVVGEFTAPGGETLPPLRRLHRQLARDLEQRAGTELLVVETDELVDAVDTLAMVLAERLQRP